jgi:DNA repair exonuclease SbcCD ATPase subunit
MRTEESLKCELARLRKEHTALFEQPVQDAASWQRMDTIRRKTSNVLNQLREDFPGWKDEAVNAMLPNESLKEHGKSEEWGATIAELKVTVAQLQKKIEVLTASLLEQALQIHKVSDLVELRLSDPLKLVVKDPLEPSKAAQPMVADNL